MADQPWELPTPVFNERVKFDQDTRAVANIDPLDRFTHQGFAFYGFDAELAIPNGAFRYILMRSGDLLPHFKRVEIAASEGPVNVNVYERDESPLIDLTSFSPQPEEIPVFNANRVIGTAPQAKFYKLGDVAPTSPLGERFLGNIFIPQAGQQGVVGNSRVAELVLKANTDYIMEIHNDPAAGGAADMTLFFQWFETPWCACQ